MEILVLLAVVLGMVIIMRLLGAWMLRINEIITELEKINKILGKIDFKEVKMISDWLNKNGYYITPKKAAEKINK